MDYCFRDLMRTRRGSVPFLCHSVDIVHRCVPQTGAQLLQGRVVPAIEGEYDHGSLLHIVFAGTDFIEVGVDRLDPSRASVQQLGGNHSFVHDNTYFTLAKDAKARTTPLERFPTKTNPADSDSKFHKFDPHTTTVHGLTFTTSQPALERGRKKGC